jgi:hypothetical protein
MILRGSRIPPKPQTQNQTHGTLDINVTPCLLLKVLILDGKSRRTSLSTQKVTSNKRRRSISSTQPGLPSTSLPNIPFTISSPTFPGSNSSGSYLPTRCHICLRPQGISPNISDCTLCGKRMCQVCTRECIICEENRCSKCCIEEFYLSRMILMNRGEDGDTVCILCLMRRREGFEVREWG